MLPDERLYTLQLFKAIVRHPSFKTYGRPEKDKEEEDGIKVSQLDAHGKPLDKSADKLSERTSEKSDDLHPNRLKKKLIDELY